MNFYPLHIILFFFRITLYTKIPKQPVAIFVPEPETLLLRTPALLYLLRIALRKSRKT